MNWLINEFVDKWISWVMNWLMNEWINQSIKEWINQSINEWINQSNNELIKQLIIETSFNQLINEWMNEWIHEWMIVMFVYLQVLLCVNSSANLFIYSCVGGQFRFTIKLWNRRRYLSNLICLFAVVTKVNRFFSVS